jgi:hypothetical protein
MESFIGGFAIGLGLWGLMTLLTGFAVLFPLPTVRGAWARLIGVIALLPLPAASLLGYLWSCLAVSKGWHFSLDEIRRLGIIVEGGLIVMALGAAYLMGALVPRSPGKKTSAAAEGKASESPCEGERLDA